MRLGELLQGVELKSALLEEEDVEITGLSYDTRTLKPGEVFVALRGYKTDGHLYIDQALRSGASAIVAEEGEGVILTGDSRKALAVMSVNWFGHPAQELKIVGVTGTNGKTTVTTFFGTCLLRRWRLRWASLAPTGCWWERRSSQPDARPRRVTISNTGCGEWPMRTVPMW